MSFKVKGAIFKNTPEKLKQRLGDRYDASKNYPDVDGFFSVREEERMGFASYIMNADANEKGEIPVRITGYNNTSQNGVKYLGLSIEPDFKTMKALEEKVAASQGVNNAAANLARATGGAVVDMDQADVF
jgi:hypothetical protein